MRAGYQSFAARASSRDRTQRRRAAGLASVRFVLRNRLAHSEVSMGLMHDAAKAAGRAFDGVRAGPEKIAIRKLSAESMATIEVTSPAFAPGQPLPLSATCDAPSGAAAPPPLEWRNVPANARSIVVICEDPDAPFSEPFVHWLVYGVPPSVRMLEGGARVAGREGQNSTMKTGFTPAAPPPGHGTHHYHFQVFALDVELDLEAGKGRRALFDAMRNHVIACGDLAGTYERT
jgi:Raf kinase inhibitor-like YbhB/YbcL family protein